MKSLLKIIALSSVLTLAAFACSQESQEDIPAERVPQEQKLPRQPPDSQQPPEQTPSEQQIPAKNTDQYNQ